MLHCQLFTPCASDTVSKSLHCQCKNPKRDFAGPVGNKPQQMRNPAGGSGPVPWRVRDGWLSHPSPPPGPAGCAGSPAPRMWLETLPRSGHVAADWNQMVGAAAGHSPPSCSSPGHCYLWVQCRVVRPPRLSPARLGGGERALPRGWNWGLLPQRQQCLTREGWWKAVDSNSFSNLILIHGLHVSLTFRCLIPFFTYSSDRSHCYFQQKTSTVTDPQFLWESEHGSPKLSLLCSQRSMIAS